MNICTNHLLFTGIVTFHMVGLVHSKVWQDIDYTGIMQAEGFQQQHKKMPYILFLHKNTVQQVKLISFSKGTSHTLQQ